MHKETHGKPRLTDIPDMTREAREVLRLHFMSADIGMTGGNFLVAETGSVAVVTNEGNEGICTMMPRVHVAVTGIEKILPTLEDLATAMRLLPRSATGQTISNYFSLLTGPRSANDANGPAHVISCSSTAVAPGSSAASFRKCCGVSAAARA